MTRRVVFLDSVPLSYGGGYESWIADALRFGSRLGYEVSAITPSRLIAAPTIASLGVRRGARADPQDPQPGEQPAGWLEAQRTLRAADVVYVKNEPHELLFALLTTRGLVPVVVGVHSSMDRPGDRFRKVREWVYRSPPYRRMLRSAALVHALHPAQAELLVSELGLPPRCVAIASNGVDTERFVPAATAETSRGLFRVLFAGRLDRQKGVDILCEAVSVMKARAPRARIQVTIAGSGPLDGLVRAMAERSDSLRPIGRVDDMPSLYQQHHMVVAPSRWEVFALVPAEALSSGLPLLLSEVPSARVFDCEAVNFCDSNSASSLAEAMLGMYQEWLDQDIYEKRRLCARRYALAHLEAGRCFEQVYNLLEQAVHG